MRRFDKLKNIRKANLLSEGRYIAKLNESTSVDLINIIIDKIKTFSDSERGNFSFEKNEFSLIIISEIDGLVINGVNINKIETTIYGRYNVLSHGYFRPGKYSGPPEDSYPDEGEDTEFDIVITNVEIDTIDFDDEYAPTMTFVGSDIQKLPVEFINAVDNKVTEMLLDSGEFDPRDKYYDYDGPDDDYDPRGGDTEAREWGGMDY
jgi:hypothetical protein